ncbi:hypothetical protein MGYG_06148 [Nannizzia gypsea CBS 118893]|uniref:Methyltransferase type 11 domain-containing protein n=1 Tax=Arthroderma gypseum (strain ATCC MYA-4604 / CBS 118893) TaxID=535722 RepID=E4V0L6_ARTGP|nr:hypothetical protein MGYG_06148 [Nannizzia gypsea CBS 118893]EFR03153.1 hypothetical protein MGYG_06148 [Nannizzia gypsea CBS 118893]
MVSRVAVQTVTQTQTHPHIRGSTIGIMMSSSRIPIPPAGGSSGQGRPKQSTPKPSSIPRSRRDSSASESEEYSRLRMVRSNSSKKSSRENITSTGTSKQPSYSFMPTSRYYAAPPSNAPPPNIPADTQQQTTSSISSWKFSRPSLPESRPRNVLRRKAPSIEQYAERNRARLQTSTSEKIEMDLPHIEIQNKVEPDFRETAPTRPSPQPVENAPVRPQYSTPTPSSQAPPTEATSSTSGSQSHIPKEFVGLSTSINTSNLPPPTPNFTGGSSPSTRYTDSPGMWSRGSTPTSLSSYSPGIVHPIHGSRLKQPSPTIFRNQRSRPNLTALSSFDETKRTCTPTTRLPRRSQTEPIAQPPGLGVRDTRHQAEWQSAGVLPGDIKPSPENRKEDVSTPKLEEPPLLLDLGATTGLSPSRPSRKGTEPLKLESSPVIWSNLASSRLPTHKRRGSASSNTRSKSPAIPSAIVNASTESLQSRSSSKISAFSPSVGLADSNTRPQLRSITPKGNHLRKTSLSGKEPKVSNNTTEVKDPKQQQPPTTGGPRRLGFFPKKSKTVPEITQSALSESRSRRGPSAGTGHEGYGKYAQRGRRTSVGSTTSRARSISASRSVGNNSVSSSHMGHEIDDFLLDRLEPVIINGGGLDGSALTRTQSGQSENHLSVISTTESKAPPSTLVQSPEPISSPLQSSLLDPGTTLHPEVKHRRSFRNSKLFGGQKTTSNYLSVSQLRPSASRRPSDASIDSRAELGYHDTPNSSSPPDSKPNKEPKKKKSEKSGRWNFFQRSNPNLREKKAKDELELTPGMPAAITQAPVSRAVAHYAILDNEQIDSDSLEDILARVEESPPTEEEIEATTGLGLRTKHGHSVLLPEPPAGLLNSVSERRPSSPKVFFNKEVLPTISPPKSDRPSRLASVGRIPPVIPSARNQHKPSLQSFSRPFSVGQGPSLTVTAAAVASNHPPLVEAIPNRFALYPPSQEEFLTFSPRKGSEVSVSSESADGRSLAAVTAVLPFPGSKLTDDEIWQEYDDFLDKVTSPQTPEDGLLHTPRSFNLATRASKALQEGLSGMNDTSPPISPLQCPEIITPQIPDHNSIHLSRSMILSALHSSITPSEPISLGDLISTYAGSKSSSTDFTDVNNPYASLGEELQNDTNAAKHAPKENSPPTTEKDQIQVDPMAQANVRSGSLMTSRWLSFGRVLFSPAKNHMQPQDQARILVIDGLGNDDWSFYCALTYPSAVVYNLTPNVPPQSTSSNPAAWDPPSNHRTIHRSGIKTPFPFPKGFFTVAVMRFPAACSEAAYDTVVSECYRVLRPGGYLELSVMDLDMVNMGTHTRKAVRMLKERIYTTDSSICLKPASDNIQRLLGKRGFANLNRCMVVVPVAGTIVQSSDTSSSNQSVANLPPQYSSSNIPQRADSLSNKKHTRAPSDDVNMSLGDLLSDPSPSPSNDESIAKMVAKVARWWHTRCYELAVFNDQNKDIWTDKMLLRECRRRGTGFRLLIAYAQKPSEVTRRTASV